MATLTLRRSYEADTGHFLTDGVPEGHPCRRQHGHRYEIDVLISGEVHEDGMVVEYGGIDSVVRPILAKVDHRNLNDLSKFCSTIEALAVAANPTVERFALWLAARLGDGIAASIRPGKKLRIAGIDIREDSRAMVEWRP